MKIISCNFVYAATMEDQVPFKVFTYWTEDSKPEVRRFGVEKTVVTSFHYLNAKLQDVYPGLKRRNYSVTWKGKCMMEKVEDWLKEKIDLVGQKIFYV